MTVADPRERKCQASPDDGVNSRPGTGGAADLWFADSNGGLESPSWSPDGSKLVWSGPAGVEIGQVPDLSGGCAVPAEGGTVVIPGGRYPDWGPADVPAPPADPGTAVRLRGGQTPAGQTPGGQTPGGQTPGVRRRVARRRGVRPRVATTR